MFLNDNVDITALFEIVSHQDILIALALPFLSEGKCHVMIPQCV